MPPRLFNIARAALFVAALVFGVIVLGVAAWLQTILEPSALTRFVPIAIFVSVFTVTFVAAILFFGSREYSYVVSQTRFELILTFLMGGLWLGLALFLSVQQTPIVECPADGDGDGPDYTTAMFHAQYHVIEAFAILETLVLFGYSLFLFALAMRHHTAGRKQVWNARVTEAVWFNPTKKASPSAKEKFTRLPPPILAFARRKSSHERNHSAPFPSAPQASLSRNVSTRTTGNAPEPPPQQHRPSHIRTQSTPVFTAHRSQVPAPPPVPPKRTPSSSRPPVVIPPPLPKKSQSYVAYASRSPAYPMPVPGTASHPSQQRPIPPSAYRSRTGPTTQARPAGTADFRPTVAPAAFGSASKPPTAQPRQPLSRNPSASRPQAGRDPPRGGTPYRERTK